MEEEKYYVLIRLITESDDVEEQYVRMFRSYQEGSSAYAKIEKELCDYKFVTNLGG